MDNSAPDRTKKISLLRAVDTFDKLCSENNFLVRRPFDINPDSDDDSDDDIDRVKFLEDQDLPPSTGAFFEVPYRDIAGLRTVDADIKNKCYETHYLREEVTMLWQEIDELPYKNNLVIEGVPGTGKSTAVWRKVLEMAYGGDNILWMTLDNSGSAITTVYFQGRYFYEFGMEPDEMAAFLFPGEIPVDTVVLDGRCEDVQRVQDCMRIIKIWVRDERANSKARSISTSCSSLVKRERPHQNTNCTYFTMQSWSIEDFYGAFVQERQPTALFDICAQLFSEEDDEENPEENGTGSLSIAGIKLSDDDDRMDRSDGGDIDKTGSVKIATNEIFGLVNRRYEFTGGSARWMFNYKEKKIERYLRESYNASNNRRLIWTGEISSTSNEETFDFFGSSRKVNGETEYFLVSQRAVEIVGRLAFGAVYPGMYDRAQRLENQSFLGWIQEAARRIRKPKK